MLNPLVKRLIEFGTSIKVVSQVVVFGHPGLFSMF
jgi:hypothetical protein